MLARLCCSMLILMHQLHVYCVDTFKTCLAKVLHKSTMVTLHDRSRLYHLHRVNLQARLPGGGGGGRSLYPLIIREDSFYASTKHG